MATVTPRRMLIFKIQKSLSYLSEPELYDLIVDYLRSEKLSAMEDEGMTQLLILNDMLSDLLATDPGGSEARQTAPETGQPVEESSPHQEQLSTSPHSDHHDTVTQSTTTPHNHNIPTQPLQMNKDIHMHPAPSRRDSGLPARNFDTSTVTRAFTAGVDGSPHGRVSLSSSMGDQVSSLTKQLAQVVRPADTATPVNTHSATAQPMPPTSEARGRCSNCVQQGKMSCPHCFMLLDSGAQVTMVGRGWMEEALPHVDIQPLESLPLDEPLVISAANGTDVPFDGWADVELQIDPVQTPDQQAAVPPPAQEVQGELITDDTAEEADSREQEDNDEPAVELSEEEVQPVRRSARARRPREMLTYDNLGQPSYQSWGPGANLMFAYAPYPMSHLPLPLNPCPIPSFYPAVPEHCFYPAQAVWTC
ncbi:hypothetical protein D4764_18G0008610 [Takifugu flavidus]|uniref:Uncharacterized protein n=1 Tax=Takifugu flavidus TaxID=433684 RepID=A0A5C6NSU5_9TELE|nr:hypothetical protein D4764_18G0008610 [Takifugu flavidus]